MLVHQRPGQADRVISVPTHPFCFLYSVTLYSVCWTYTVFQTQHGIPSNQSSLWTICWAMGTKRQFHNLFFLLIIRCSITHHHLCEGHQHQVKVSENNHHSRYIIHSIHYHKNSNPINISEKRKIANSGWLLSGNRVSAIVLETAAHVRNFFVVFLLFLRHMWDTHCEYSFFAKSILSCWNLYHQAVWAVGAHAAWFTRMLR